METISRQYCRWCKVGYIYRHWEIVDLSWERRFGAEGPNVDHKAAIRHHCFALSLLS